MKDTLIGWCHHTINFWWGCEERSRECVGCYAREFLTDKGERFNVLRLKCSPWLEAESLDQEAKRKNTRELVFTCSMSDFFHEDADKWRDEAWDVIRNCRNLIWMVLTKRPERIEKQLPTDWDPNGKFSHVWLGTTCGVRDSFPRIDILREVPCSLRFLSCEPLMEELSGIDLTGLGWILCGGTSGKQFWQKHEMDIRWAASLFDAAEKAHVPFLFKQMSAPKTESGINGLGLYLAARDGCEADSRTDCIRIYPAGIVPPLPKGKRWDTAQWRQYCRRREIDLPRMGHLKRTTDGNAPARKERTPVAG
jgi:protein gp37